MATIATFTAQNDGFIGTVRTRPANGVPMACPEPNGLYQKGRARPKRESASSAARTGYQCDTAAIGRERGPQQFGAAGKA